MWRCLDHVRCLCGLALVPSPKRPLTPARGGGVDGDWVQDVASRHAWAVAQGLHQYIEAATRNELAGSLGTPDAISPAERLREMTHLVACLVHPRDLEPPYIQLLAQRLHGVRGTLLRVEQQVLEGLMSPDVPRSFPHCARMDTAERLLRSVVQVSFLLRLARCVRHCRRRSGIWGGAKALVVSRLSKIA